MQALHTTRLSDLLLGIDIVSSDENLDVVVSGLALDSRQVQSDMLFVAIQGEAAHGLSYAREAVNAGAVAVLFELSGSEELISNLTGESAAGESLAGVLSVPVLGVESLRDQLGVIASRFYGEPSKSMLVVGITGTNGKTSSSHFFAQVLSRLGKACGVIGTLGYGVYGQLQSGSHTTPDAIKVQSLLSGFLRDGLSHAVMEVSSHALDQGRVTGVEFDVAVLTNLSHDHLDYHGDLSRYAQAKKRLFQMPGLRYAVVNRDDEFSRELLELLPENVSVLSYGLSDAEETLAKQDSPDVHGQILTMDTWGFEIKVSTPAGEAILRSSLLGRFNISNLLAVLTVMLHMKIPLQLAVQHLSKVQAVIGRMEHFGGGARLPLVVVDYAHTPDALQQVLQTLRSHCPGSLWCVFGCGGDRDCSKRPEMGAIAERYAEQVVVTDDNPRHENAEKIIEDILAGMQHPEIVHVLSDRAKAIEYAVTHAVSGDVVLIAGKGHEEYQLVGDRKLPFSDRSHVDEILKEVA